VFAEELISDFLYFDENGGDISHLVNRLERYKEILQWAEDQWKDLIRGYASQTAPAYLAKILDQDVD
jgi:hypothetical protein